MEFHELLENEKFKATIGPEKLAIYSGEDGIDLMWDDFHDKSETILVMKADHSSDHVFGKWNGFYIWTSSDTGEDGASDDILSFFGEYPFENWSSCETELHSSKLPLQTLKQIALRILPDEDDEIEINGSYLRRRGAELISI